MNILYISNLTGNLFAGPNHSVPAQIKAQSKVDCVMWYNLNHVKRDEWTNNGLNCRNLSDFPSGRLKDLPEPFCAPDLVVIEEFYCYPFNKMIYDVQKKDIPYIIIPRSELTEKAQQKKAWKKKIGNLMYFRKMARRAIAIQYLSQQECIESGSKWNSQYLVIPNGTDTQEYYKTNFSKNEIKAIYIGRYEQYQKGLDILIESIANVQEELRHSRFQLDMYGVDQEGAVDVMKLKISEYGITDLVRVNDAVYGEDKKRVLIQSDVFIMTSRFEGMPMGMIEAFAFGLPCVATVGTNLAYEIKEYDAGWIAENTIDSVTTALLRMVNEYRYAKTKGKNARTLSSVFSWDAIAQKSHKEYEKMIERHGR